MLSNGSAAAMKPDVLRDILGQYHGYFWLCDHVDYSGFDYCF